MQETKLKADLSALKHNYDRLNERNIVLEHQAKSLESNHKQQQMEERQKNQDEINKLCDGYNLHIKELIAKHTTQSEEISLLRATLAEFELASSKKIASFQLR
jgi:hypothetical protein